MLPVLDKPLIHYGVKEAIDAGLTEIAILTGRGKEAIENYFDKNYELENELQAKPKKLALLDEVNSLIQKGEFVFKRQGAMLGLGDAIYKSRIMIGDEPFGVILADDLCDTPGHPNVMAQMIEVYKKYRKSIVAIMEVPEDRVDQYGIIEGDEVEDGVFKVTNMIEKPSPEEAPSRLAIIGRYILTPDIFDILKETKPGAGGEIQITDALKVQAESGNVLAYKFQGIRFDCGSVKGYIEATNYFFNK
jgi:UTP--glucose-1-phosphate uridylyltransferase